ncbi:MAG: peptidoglycan editing factor PgeF [Bacteroidaceae bacterium]|nr:peptidoglycan editing factor PgeF [Bacteroidaceae bacterium]
MNSLLFHPIDKGAEAFSTRRDATLPYPVLQCHQVHSDDIAVIDSPAVSRDDLQGIDAMITSLPDFAIGVRTADCIPVLLHDAKHRVVAAVHAGWRGTVMRITSKTIDKMHNIYGTEPSDLFAIIGPGIGPDSFQVGEEVVDAFREALFPMPLIHSWRGERVEGTMQGGHHIDLWEANAWLLRESGVRDDNIHVCGICTYQHNEQFYSARREGIRCPRIINSIKIIK